MLPRTVWNVCRQPCPVNVCHTTPFTPCVAILYDHDATTNVWRLRVVADCTRRTRRQTSHREGGSPIGRMTLSWRQRAHSFIPLQGMSEYRFTDLQPLSACRVVGWRTSRRVLVLPPCVCPSVCGWDNIVDNHGSLSLSLSLSLGALARAGT